jgi:hypothetical protein
VHFDDPYDIEAFRHPVKTHSFIKNRFLPPSSIFSKLPINLIDFLAKYKPSGAGPDFGRGHDQATGGSLTLSQWSEFLTSLGF